MEPERVAELATIAIANRLGEAWISNQPTLSLFYLGQWFPTLMRETLVPKESRMNDER